MLTRKKIWKREEDALSAPNRAPASAYSNVPNILLSSRMYAAVLAFMDDREIRQVIKLGASGVREELQKFDDRCSTVYGIDAHLSRRWEEYFRLASRKRIALWYKS